jgi:hypothetical protein
MNSNTRLLSGEIIQMALEKTEHAQFIYITYSRQGYKDVEQFRITLSSLMSDRTSEKDIVIDFGTSKLLTSPEIGSVVRLAQGIAGTSRFLRVIPGEGLYKQLTALNLTHLSHLAIYKTREDFAEQLKKMQ